MRRTSRWPGIAPDRARSAGYERVVELRGDAFSCSMASSIGMAVFFGLEILDEDLALNLTDAWRVVWFVAWIVMIANLILALALHHARGDGG
jgi:hypothetical protein